MNEQWSVPEIPKLGSDEADVGFGEKQNKRRRRL